MLVLLIIFMVALPVATVSLDLNLPPARESAGAPPTVVSLQAGGHLFIGDTPTTLDSLTSDLGRTHSPKEQVFVRADRKVPYKQFMAVIDTLRAGGYRKVGLVNEAVS
jgi:biopolymer transport protein ExbD